MRKPDPDDQCTCGHPRYGHIALSDACTFCEKCGEFKLRLTYQIAVEVWLEFPQASRVDLSRSLYRDVALLTSPLIGYLLQPHGNQFLFLGKRLAIDDTLGENELAFITNDEGLPEKVALI